MVLAAALVAAAAVRYGGGFKFSVPVPPTGPSPTEGTGLGDVGPVVRLEPFVVSEVGSDDHTSTVTFEVEVTDVEGRDAVRSHSSEIREAVLSVLADTKLTEIGAPEEFEYLKNKVRSRIQSLLPNHVVRRVLITEFLSL